jgi:glycosyltransferase involved in cell wall biosynthesis
MLTVLIATYNGADTLPRTLAALCELEEPDSGWRLLLVDNGSEDGTREVIDTYRQRLPLTHLFEPRPGKCRALNAGLERIEGDLVVFTDDDVIPEVDWLCQLRRCADERPEYSIFGGPVLPLWPSEPAEWITEWVPLSPVYSLLPRDESGPREPRRVFGPNMAIRSEALRSGPRFDESLGPSGSRYSQGDETDFLIRLSAAGHRAWFCREAAVRHIIKPIQLTERWILEKAAHFARSEYVLASRHGFRIDGSAAAGLYGTHKAWLTDSLRTVFARLSETTEPGFGVRWERRLSRGRAQGARWLAKQKATAAFRRDRGGV